MNTIVTHAIRQFNAAIGKPIYVKWSMTADDNEGEVLVTHEEISDINVVTNDKATLIDTFTEFKRYIVTVKNPEEKWIQRSNSVIMNEEKPEDLYASYMELLFENGSREKTAFPSNYNWSNHASPHTKGRILAYRYINADGTFPTPKIVKWFPELHTTPTIPPHLKGKKVTVYTRLSKYMDCAGFFDWRKSHTEDDIYAYEVLN